MLNVEGMIENGQKSQLGEFAGFQVGLISYCMSRKKNKLPFINPSLFMLGLIP